MTVYWTMKDGNKIDVDTMSLDHLRNTLKMIIRNNQEVIKRKNQIQRAFTLNGDMAQEFNDAQDISHEEEYMGIFD